MVATPAAAESVPRVLLQPDAFWTAGQAAPQAGWVVLVEGQRIVAVGPKAGLAGGTAQIVPLPGTTLIPGLIEMHSHLLLHPYNEASWDDQVLKEAPFYRVLRAGRDAERTLMSGFTTERELGTEGAGDADVSLKKAIADGTIAGPRLLVTTRAIVAKGAYGPRKGFRSDMDLPQGAQEVSGADEIVAAVREQAALGADWIKVYADYRIGPDGSVRPAFTEEELVHGGGFARVLWRVGPRWAAAMRLADRVAPHRTASPLLRERSGHARTAALVARSAHLPAG